MAAKDKQSGEKAVSYRVDQFVDTLWDGYEARLSRFRQRLTDQENAYVKLLQDMGELRSKYHENLKGVAKDLRDFGNSGENADSLEAVNGEQVLNEMQTEKDSFARVQELAMTPLKFSLELVERTGRNFEERAIDWIEFNRERRQVWSALTDDYLNFGRTSHRSFLRAFERTVRSMRKSDAVSQVDA